MAGHSQWNNIKFRKARQDALKSKVFSKFSKEIYLYAKSDPNPNSNPSLRNSIKFAKDNEVPNHVVEKAIKKATEKSHDGSEVIYECVQGSNAFIITSFTNNKTRTVAEIREVLRKFNGSLGKCQYLFDLLYLIQISLKSEVPGDVITCCKKLEEDEEFYYLFFETQEASKAYLLLKNHIIVSKIVFVPKEKIEVNEIGENLLNALEDLEDVYQVSSNMYFL